MVTDAARRLPCCLLRVAPLIRNQCFSVLRTPYHSLETVPGPLNTGFTKSPTIMLCSHMLNAFVIGFSAAANQFSKL